MNAINRRHEPILQLARNRFVGREHEFLDQLMRFVVLDSLETQRASGLFVDDHFHFRKIEVERAVGETAPAQNRGEIPGGVQTTRELVVRRFLDKRIGLFVSEPAGALDDGAGEAGTLRSAVLGEADENRMRQPDDVGIEAANAIAQALRQHRDDAIDEVNAVPTMQRLAIECAARGDISGDVRDVDPEFPLAARQFLDIDRVVEIARIVGIDRDDEFVPQVFAFPEAIRIDRLWNFIRLGEHGARKLERQVILPNDRKHVDPGISGAAEQLDDFALGIDVARLPRLQSDDDLVVRLRWAGRTGQRLPLDIDVVNDPRIVRHDVEEVTRLLQSADDRVVGALENANDAALGTIARPARPGVIGIASDARDDAIAIHGGAGVFGGNENVATFLDLRGRERRSPPGGLAVCRSRGRLPRAGYSGSCECGRFRRRVPTHAALPSSRLFAVSKADGAGQFLQVERPIFRPAQESQNSLFDIAFSFHFDQRPSEKAARLKADISRQASAVE